MFNNVSLHACMSLQRARLVSPGRRQQFDERRSQIQANAALHRIMLAFAGRRQTAASALHERRDGTEGFASCKTEMNISRDK